MASDVAGATAVEFALIAIPFLSIIFFIVQMCLIFFWSQSIEQATMQSSRSIRAGSVQLASLSAQQFKDQIFCPYLTAGIACTDTIVSIRRVPKTWAANHTGGIYTFIDNSGPSLVTPATQQAAATYCPGGPGDMILVDVVFKAPILVAWAWPASTISTIDGQGVFLVRATAVVLNEPFQTTVVSTC